MFYVETLADLGKSVGKGKTPEMGVGQIADKFPDEHGTPCVHHVSAALSDLAGWSVPMTGQIPVAGGRLIKHSGKQATVFDGFPEVDAFHRWINRDFFSIERTYASVWRQQIIATDLRQLADRLALSEISSSNCRSIADAWALADRFVHDQSKALEQFRALFTALSGPPQYLRQVLVRWNREGRPALADFAPYAAHLVTVEIFFMIALKRGFVSTERPSNRVDVAYLFYLPFCMVFVSSDRLHRRCSPFFLRSDQDFVWGPELKEDLNRMNDHFLKYSQSEREKGIMSFARRPPEDSTSLTIGLWDRHLVSNWRDLYDKPPSSSAIEDIIPELRKIVEAANEVEGRLSNDSSDSDILALKRTVRKRKGSWYQLPKDFG